MKINGTRIVPVDTVRFIKPLSAEDRSRAGDKLDIDASKFNVRIEFADKSTKLAVETIEDIQGQGIGLVNIGADRHVPATNIRAADVWSQEDAAKLKESGDYTLSHEFRSRVETTAGTILSIATAEVLLRARALGQGGPTASSAAAPPQPDDTAMLSDGADSPPRARTARGKGPRPSAE